MPSSIPYIYEGLVYPRLPSLKLFMEPRVTLNLIFLPPLHKAFVISIAHHAWFYAILEIKHKACVRQTSTVTTGYIFQHLFIYLETGSHCVARAGLEFEIYLPQPPKHEISYLLLFFFFFCDAEDQIQGLAHANKVLTTELHAQPITHS